MRLLAACEIAVSPRVWINASDIYNRVPFVFDNTAFAAICSDLSKYPLSGAVAASAAVPLAFAPAVVQAFPGTCNEPLPPWVARAAANRNASPMLSAYSKAVMRYRDGAVPYIKLMDGGLVDNYGVSALTIVREILRDTLWPDDTAAGGPAAAAGYLWWWIPKSVSPATGSIRWKGLKASI